GELDELKSVLALENMPLVIECFDISNIAGKQAVGSMVHFVGGRAKKSEYRKFRIKSITGIDDYSMMREVVRRRYSRLIREQKKMPDLILIDGGMGHLAAVKDELNGIGLGNVPVVSIAKEYNHLYVFGRKEPIRLSPGSRVLLLIQRVRDEAHRFAISYHKKLRSAENFETELNAIRGIGPIKEKMLIGYFGNIGRVRQASYRELLKAGIGKKAAGEIFRFFNGAEDL
ncbi:MAG: excinuclease ABC subunit C, partial [Candidatus Omnitrophica bacterium]|nr:excinuclease ABC subunit C [Candidatus Omnitrophota bacterium]